MAIAKATIYLAGKVYEAGSTLPELCEADAAQFAALGVIDAPVQASVEADAPAEAVETPAEAKAPAKQRRA